MGVGGQFTLEHSSSITAFIGSALIGSAAVTSLDGNDVASHEGAASTALLSEGVAAEGMSSEGGAAGEGCSSVASRLPDDEEPTSAGAFLAASPLLRLALKQNS